MVRTDAGKTYVDLGHKCNQLSIQIGFILKE